MSHFNCCKSYLDEDKGTCDLFSIRIIGTISKNRWSD